jgi:LysR family positive regulator for ilvC
LQRWHSLLAGFASRQLSPVGILRLYCSVTATYSVLAGFLPEVRMRYPGIEIHVNTGDQALAIPRVREGQEDLAIAAHSGQLSPKLDFQSLARSPLVCIAPRIECQVRSTLHSAEAIDWAALPFIIAESGLARVRLEQWFRQRDIEPLVYAYVSGHEAIVSLVALGFGLAVVPRLVLENSPLRDRVDVVKAGPRLQPFDIGLVARKQRLLDPVVRVVWELAGQHGYTGEHDRHAVSPPQFIE